MEKKQKSIGARIVKGFIIFLISLIAIPVILIGFSFIGRISPDSVIPASFSVYLRVPRVVRTADHLFSHKGLEDILADPAFSSLTPIVSSIREKQILSNPIMRFVGKGELCAGMFENGSFVLAWDMTSLSLFSRLLPGIISKMTIPGLYRVQSGRLSRFEFRTEEDMVLFIQPWKNLLLVSNNAPLFESILMGNVQFNEKQETNERLFSSNDFDAGILVDGTQFLASVSENENIPSNIADLIASLNTTGFTEARISIGKETIQIESLIPLSSNIESLSSVLTVDSRIPALLGNLPEKTQYSSIISAAPLRTLMDIALSIKKEELAPLLKKADTSSRLLLGLSLNELLYSWTGNEIGVFGLEGKPKPVFSVRISNEVERKKVFEKLLSSFALTGDNSVVLDGVRIPRIRLPDFLSALLRLWDIFVPSPYYLVESGFLFISESPENLVSCVNAMRQNKILVKTELWKDLTTGTSDQSALNLYYSLDRSVPFFIRGSGVPQRILQLYGKGLFKIAIRKEKVIISLQARSGNAIGPIPILGYPMSFDIKLGNRVDVLQFPQKNEKRVIISAGKKNIISLRPDTREIYSFESDDDLWWLPAKGFHPRSSENAAAWVVSSRGEVSLVDGNLVAQSGFPVASGIKISAEPAAFDSNLYLCDQDSSVHVMDSSGTLKNISMPFTGILRSPPSFIEVQGSSFMASYPKSFLGEIWLTDLQGKPLSGWPVPVSGIAFGSPLLCVSEKVLKVAFLTQAGELIVVDKEGILLPGFPLQLDGVFFFQPIFDGTFFWALSSTGELFKIDLNGSTSSLLIPDLWAESGFLVHYDINGDGESEIFATGDGNTLYGYFNSLEPIDGFPLPAWGLPWFGDLNGDKKIECIAAGMDNLLYAWQLR